MATTLADFGHVSDTRLRRLLAVWLDARGNRTLLTRNDIDPAAAAELGSFLWLCDFERREQRFHYRMAGSGIARRHRDIVIGKYLDELLTGRALTRVTAYFSKVVEEPSIGFIGGRLYSDSESPARGERLALPLSDGAGSARMILGATIETEWAPGVEASLPDRQVIVFTPVY